MSKREALLSIFLAILLLPLLNLNMVLSQEQDKAEPKSSVGDSVTGISEETPDLVGQGGEGTQDEEAEEAAGEFFGLQVPLSNYYFAKGVFLVFGAKGRQPQTPQEQEEYIWDQLLLNFEAFRRDIKVAQEEADDEIGKLLNAEQVAFDWKQDKEAYAKWTQERINVTPEVLENQLRFLLQNQKLEDAIKQQIDPPVTDDEALQEFLNEHNSINLELRQFEGKVLADEFYQKVAKNKKFWEEEKEKRPKEFRSINMVSLEFLIDLWGIPRDALFAMMKLEDGEVYQPESIYKNYAVFKVIGKRPANEAEFESQKESYYAQLRTRKKNQGYGEWFKNFKVAATIKVYPVASLPAAEETVQEGVVAVKE
ncbi:MAG: hypothetical protein KKC84_02620 [Candidatus Omnitrophica bacterium]|nr:hypothetical protein [Candidatus Omnitrophota bacterium]